MQENNKTCIRIAKRRDAAAILAIYAPFVEQTAITFTLKVPTLGQVRQTMGDILRHYPYLVCEVDGKVVGFAYAYRVRPHAAFNWNAELTVYIDPRHHGHGIATALYTALFALLKAQGFCNLYAVITLPNEASIALHKHFGFEQNMVQKACGYKLGKWRDVLWMEYRINGAANPAIHGFPKPPGDLNVNDIQTALAMASALLMGTSVTKGAVVADGALDGVVAGDTFDDTSDNVVADGALDGVVAAESVLKSNTLGVAAVADGVVAAESVLTSNTDEVNSGAEFS
ncbi:MAG: GNAT family N-acetyltransferase [Coriobacteriales bacterium]|jgi:phosphinothricin acetyltransferase|nr:GNAT family N-acetyltransferase [Coriobacteriales bacterium]